MSWEQIGLTFYAGLAALSLIAFVQPLRRWVVRKILNKIPPWKQYNTAMDKMDATLAQLCINNEKQILNHAESQASFRSMEKRMNVHEDRIDSLDSRLLSTTERMERFSSRLSELEGR